MSGATTPSTLLGHRKDGRPIYLIQGASQPAGEQPASQGTGSTGDSAGSATGAASGTGQQEQATPGPFDHITDPVELRALAVRLQNEAATQRTKSRDQVARDAATAAQKDLTDRLATALGITKETKDPAELERQINQLTAANTERDRELAIYRAALAPGMNVDAGRLLDSRSFMRAMSDVDPAADGAAQAITDRIKAAVSSDPSLQASRVIGGGSVGHAGGAGDQTNQDLSKLHGAGLVEAAYAANAKG